nr:N-acetyltransferase-like protein [uncultured Mediterranean phage uvMED]
MVCHGKETIHLDFINVSNYIHPITTKAAYEVASNLRPEDRRELEEGWGVEPIRYLLFTAQTTPCVYFTSPSGKAAGMAGVGRNNDIWMLCTPVIHEKPMLFVREAKRYVDSRKEPLLWNIVDKRNTAHIKLLKFLGFKFLREVLHGPNYLPFIEFCRVCRC